jgi:drug/metabolite transporter (DMT)-like permease
LGNLQLFVACVAIWGTTWLAITYQLGSVAPEASVSYRFLIASLLVFAWCKARGLPLGYGRRDHAWLALQGALMFGIGYIFVYYAEQHVVSGLVAVGFSATPLISMLFLRLFFGTPMTGHVAVGGALGVAGITLIFLPEIAQLRGDRDVLQGLGFAMAAVVVSALGSMVAHRNHDARIPVWQSMAWGMLYGAGLSLVVTLALGKPLAITFTPGYLLSLAYLAMLGSVLAFGAYLTLMNRIGAARSGYIGVMTPIVALLVSAAFEGFHWQALTWVGVAVSVIGNAVILRRRPA